MAKKNEPETVVLDEAPKAATAADKDSRKNAAVILQNCLATLDQHPDAMLISVQHYDVKERDRHWYDVPLLDQEEIIIRVALKMRTK